MVLDFGIHRNSQIYRYRAYDSGTAVSSKYSGIPMTDYSVICTYSTSWTPCVSTVAK